MEDFLLRMWEDLIGRYGGPMKIRLILQPTVAAIIAIRAGMKDARAGRPLYFWSIFTDPVNRPAIIREGWKDVSRVFVIAVVIDCIYQLIVFRWVYMSQALIVAVVLALLPYLIFRGLLNRLGRLWQRAVSASE